MQKFMSVTKFVDYFYNKLKADNFNVSSATLYFEDKKCFINKYKNSCTKPVFIEFSQPFINPSPCADNDNGFYILWKYMTHQEILNEFGCPFIISFKESKKKTLPTEKKVNPY